MASISMLKVSAVALLGLGAADVAWINLSLGPRVLDVDEPAAVAQAPERVAVAPAPPAPPPRVEAAPAAPAPPVEPPPPPAPVAAEPPRPEVESIYFASMSGRVGSGS